MKKVLEVIGVFIIAICAFVFGLNMARVQKEEITDALSKENQQLKIGLDSSYKENQKLRIELYRRAKIINTLDSMLDVSIGHSNRLIDMLNDQLNK